MPVRPWCIATSCLTWAFGPEPPAHLEPTRAAGCSSFPARCYVPPLIFWCGRPCEGFALPWGNGILTGTLSQHIESHMESSLSLAALRVSSIPSRDPLWDFAQKPNQETVVLGSALGFPRSWRATDLGGSGQDSKAGPFPSKRNCCNCTGFCVFTHIGSVNLHKLLSQPPFSLSEKNRFWQRAEKGALISRHTPLGITAEKWVYESPTRQVLGIKKNNTLRWSVQKT